MQESERGNFSNHIVEGNLRTADTVSFYFILFLLFLNILKKINSEDIVMTKRKDIDTTMTTVLLK